MQGSLIAQTHNLPAAAKKQKLKQSLNRQAAKQTLIALAASSIIDLSDDNDPKSRDKLRRQAEAILYLSEQLESEMGESAAIAHEV